MTNQRKRIDTVMDIEPAPQMTLQQRIEAVKQAKAVNKLQTDGLMEKEGEAAVNVFGLSSRKDDDDK